MQIKNLFRALIVVSLLVFSSCGNKEQKEEITVLIRMMPAQQRFFKQKILPGFEKKYNCKVNLTTFNNASDLQKMLKLDAQKSNPQISLVKTPFEVTRQLVDDGLVQKLSSIVSQDQLDMDMAVYHPVAAALGMVNGEFYYVPRKLETRVLFYRKSKVADAYNKFSQYKDTINAELKELNGYGLPKGYTLEQDPSEWDIYDMYVVGSIWAKETYNGSKSGRIAHRGAPYNGTSQFLIDRAYQLGATQDDIRRMSGPAIDEMYLWEQIFVKNGIYNKGMWEDPWRGSHIYNAIKDGKVFLAYLQQIDLFNVHGWAEDPGMPSYLEDPADMGVAMVPTGVSFTLDSTGTPIIKGTKKISTGGWWWGVPTAAPKAKLGYELAKYITSKSNNAIESSQFGMIPVRKDLLNNLGNVFQEGWVGDIYRVSIEQISQQLDDSIITIVPLDKEYPKISNNYIEAWYDIAIDGAKEDSIGLAVINTKLNDKYIPEEKKILGKNYPSEKKDVVEETTSEETK